MGYAQALLDIAQSKGDLDAVHSDVEILNELINKSTELRDIMTNPLVTNEKKKDLIKQISINGKFNTFTSNFLDLLVDKGRIDCIFEVLYCQAANIKIATVKSAVALDEDQQYVIAKKIRELTKSKSVKIKQIIDRTLIGGFRVEYGSYNVDLSVRGALESVKKEIKNVTV